MKIKPWHEAKMATNPEYAAASKQLDRFATEPQNFRISRDGERDLTLTGWKLGRAMIESNYGNEPLITVTIYATVAGRYVTHNQWHSPKGRGNEVTVANDPAELVAQLKFGRATVLAWNEACSVDPQLAELETESIE